VALYTQPTNGCVPLNGVSLRALVTNFDRSGYNNNYNGINHANDLTYNFDCDNNGTFEKTVTSGETEVIVNSLCNYPSAGSYTARVRVEAYNTFATDTAIVKVGNCAVSNYQPVYVQPNLVQPVPQTNYNGALTVQKLVSNLSNGTAYQMAVTANPGDYVSFKITVSSGSNLNRNLIVSDIIPSAIVNPRDLRVDSQIVAGNIASGFGIGDLNPGQQKTVTFTATVANASNFKYGQTSLIDTASARNDSVSNSSTATVYVWRQSVLGATRVSTGIIFDLSNYIIAALVALIAGLWLFRSKLSIFGASLKKIF
jgi:hypothetical protein